MTQVSAWCGSASGTGWTNPTYAQGADDTNDATWVDSSRNSTSSALVCGGFGTFSGIPGGSTINFVDVRVNHHESHTGNPLDYVSARLYADATGQGAGATNLTLSLTETPQTIQYTDVTLAELQAGTMNVQLIGDRANSTTTSTVYIDSVQLTVDYTASTPQTIDVYQAVETDTAQAVTSRKTVAVAYASETDIAQTVTPSLSGGPQSIPVGQTTETSTSQEVGRRKTYAIGRAGA